MHFRPYFSDWGQEVDKFLASYFAKREQEAQREASIAGDLIADIYNFTKGGKKLRAGLVKLGYEAFGGKNPKVVLPAAAATEILHSAFLVHDDIIDSDLIRHGRSTVHAKYSAITNSLHYGEAMAIVAGDIAFFETSRIILSSNLASEIKNKILNEMIETAIRTGFGEALDVELANKKRRNQKGVMTVHTLKTAFYTFIGPLTYGAIAAGAAEANLAKIRDYGLPVGIAFQIQDDILGMFGSEKVLGKPVDSDIKEGKNTLLYIQALNKVDKSQKAFLIKVWGNRNITAEEVRQARRIIIDTGSLQYSANMARKLVTKGKKSIPKITKNKEYREILSTLADYIIERER